jgi:hypothetical protein
MASKMNHSVLNSDINTIDSGDDFVEESRYTARSSLEGGLPRGATKVRRHHYLQKLKSTAYLSGTNESKENFNSNFQLSCDEPPA